MKPSNQLSRNGPAVLGAIAALVLAIAVPASADPELDLAAEALVPVLSRAQTEEESVMARGTDFSGLEAEPESFRLLGQRNSTTFGVATNPDDSICLVAAIDDATKMTASVCTSPEEFYLHGASLGIYSYLTPDAPSGYLLPADVEIPEAMSARTPPNGESRFLMSTPTDPLPKTVTLSRAMGAGSISISTIPQPE